MKHSYIDNSKPLFIIAVLAVIIFGIFFLIKYSDIYISRSIALCEKEEATRQNCYAKLVSDTLEKRGLAKAFDAFALIYDKNPKFADDCHGNTHTLGGAAYKLFHAGKDVELTEKTSYCGFGFYHGFLIELFSEGGTMKEAREFCSYAGTSLKGKSGDAEGACYHAMGHGTVDGADSRIWGSVEKIITPGLEICARVADTEPHRRRCASGTFNSLAIMYKDPKYRLTVNKADPYLICENLRPDFFKRSCYEEMNTIVLYIADFDLKKSLLYIPKIEEETYAASAVESLSSYGAKVRDRSARETENKKVITNCRVLSGNISLACIRGYGAGLVEFGTPEREYEESLSFCQNGDLSDEEKNSCLHRVLFYLAAIYPQKKIASLCGRYVASPYQELCKPFN